MTPTENLLRFFAYEHLKGEHLRDVSRMCGDLACSMEDKLLDGAEKTAGMRKLLEAKDCFVRAVIFEKKEIPTKKKEIPTKKKEIPTKKKEIPTKKKTTLQVGDFVRIVIPKISSYNGKYGRIEKIEGGSLPYRVRIKSGGILCFHRDELVVVQRPEEGE